jgi:Trypsin-like peptidase domain/Divergent InlB B-repeat domain
MKKTPLGYLTSTQFGHIRALKYAALGLGIALVLAGCGGSETPNLQFVAAQNSPQLSELALRQADSEAIKVTDAYVPPPMDSYQPSLGLLPADTTQRTRTVQDRAIYAKKSLSPLFTAALNTQEVQRKTQEVQNNQKSVARDIAFGRDLIGPKSSKETTESINWQSSPEGMRGEFAVLVPGAIGVRVGLLIERLPDTARLSFFAPNGSIEHTFSGAQVKASLQTLQAAIRAGERRVASQATSNLLGQYWTPFISGSEVIVAIDLPKGISPTDVRLSAPRVSHFFEAPVANVVDAVKNPEVPKAIGDSASCNVDASCHPENTAENNAVARMVFTNEAGRSSTCTGALVADRARTGTPYFLTANHCIDKQSEASTLQTFWFYRSSACGSGQLTATSTSRSGGAQLLFNSANTDVAFLRLNTAPPAGVAYAGWSVGVPAIGSSVVGIHHPSGDLLKTAFGNLRVYQSCTSSGANSSTFQCSTAAQSVSQFLEVRYTRGTTEGGSSGSPLFTNEGGSLRIVGQLYGGTSSCSLLDGSNVYGRFDISYNQGLSTYLEAGSAPITYALQVRRAGTGSGSVLSTPAGISCGSACAQVFPSGTAVTLVATPSAGSIFTGWSGSCTGVGSCSVSMTQARDVTANFSAPVVSLSAALDNPSLTFTTGGSQPFFAQTQHFIAGGSAVQAGVVGDSQVSQINTTISGPGRVTFAWRTSSELGYDFLVFYVNGVAQRSLSGLSPWTTVTFDLAAGVNNLSWAYEKDSSFTDGLDTAWLDNVQFTSTVQPPLPNGSSAIVNGSFETNAGWTYLPFDLTAVPPANVPVLADGGSRVAWICGVLNCVHSMIQRVVVPPNASALVLDFSAYVRTQDSFAARFDTLDVQIVGVSNPSQPVVVASLSNLDAGQAWRRITREVTGLAGQTVELRFIGRSDAFFSTDFFIDNVSVTFRTTAVTQPPTTFLPESGWYWRESEGGRGWAIERQGDRLFAAGFMYDEVGAPAWYVSTLTRQTDGSYLGNLDRYTGGQSLLGLFRPATPSTFASMRLRFSSARTVRLDISSLAQGNAPVFSIQTTDLVRFPISTPTPFSPSSMFGISGWWWNESEPGRGYFVEVQGSQAFVAQFGYTTQGLPNWYASSMQVSTTNDSALLSAPMQEYINGQTLGGAYRLPTVAGSPGQWSFRFNSLIAGVVVLPNGREVPVRRFTF